MRHRHALLAILSLAFSFNTLHAQFGKDNVVEISARQLLSEVHKDGAVALDANRREFSFDRSIVERVLPSARRLLLTDFPVTPSTSMDLDLRRARSVVDANTRFVVAGKDGEAPGVPPQVISYTGSIRGEEGSKIFLTFAGESMVASIQHADGSSYVLGPALDEKADESRHVLLNGNAVRSELGESFDCMTLGDPEIPAVGVESVQVVDSTTLLEVEVAVETDTEFFKATGRDVAKAQAYTIALFSMVSTIYEEELHVTIYIPWMKTWTQNAPDPYNVAGNAYALPDKVAPYWRDNYADVHRDVAHVMTSIGNGGGGFGYYNALCGGAGDQSFSVSSVQGYHAYPTFAFTYDVYIVAHELGHNFNVPHSHNCYWGAPIDTCMIEEGIDGGCLSPSQTPRPNPGSIMSYCGGINYTELGEFKVRMTFLPQVAAVMRETATNAACLTEPEDPTVVLLRPRGREQFVWNRQGVTSITWRSARVDFVDLFWSSDGGSTWNQIANDLPAGDEKYEWELPEVCSRSVLVRIAEASDPALADTCTFPFTLQQKDPTGLVARYTMDGDSEDKAACGFYPGSGGGAFDFDRRGVEGRAYRFNGQEWLTTPNFAEVFNTDITLAMWFRLDATNGVQTFLAQDWAAGGAFAVFSWNGQFGGAFWTAASAVPFQVWGSWLEAGRWYHGVVTYDGEVSKAYIDGVEAGSTPFGATLKYSETPLFLGSRNGSENLAGRLDEVRIYDRALTPQEVRALYDAENQLLAAPLLESPPDGSSNLPKTVGLQWDTVPTATAYHVQLGTAATFAPPSLIVDHSSIQGVTYNVDGLVPQTEYFWRVRGSNASGAGEWSSPFDFTTGAFSAVGGQSGNAVGLSLQARMERDGRSLRLRYALPARSNISIAIYDQLGREIDVNEGKEEEGVHERIIATGHLPAGVYFCRLTAGGAESVAAFVVGR